MKLADSTTTSAVIGLINACLFKLADTNSWCTLSLDRLFAISNSRFEEAILRYYVIHADLNCGH